ncbi:M26 family peptidase%2C C-terminal [Streptococcus pneumoniae]|nr:M26 family peptidase%2C C-terminal [Streptococcus pneumoniae]
MGTLGYYEGFVPYVSNQYKNAAFSQIEILSSHLPSFIITVYFVYQK